MSTQEKNSPTEQKNKRYVFAQRPDDDYTCIKLVEGNYKDPDSAKYHAMLEVFRNKEDAQVIKKIVHEGTIKLQGIHKYLEDEITAVQYVD